tara:strand:- start:671 stop:781 length:111 start_codon:yes stop_codon:yes gene_type:complete
MNGQLALGPVDNSMDDRVQYQALEPTGLCPIGLKII